MLTPKLRIVPGEKDHYDETFSFIIIEYKSEPLLYATVENWEAFKDEDKSNLAWIWSLVQAKKPAFTQSDFNEYAGVGYKSNGYFTLPAVYSGQGLAWLEPFIKGKAEPTNNPKNGVFVSVKATPHIYGYEWREYSKDNNGALIKRPVQYGETIQLHIYTNGLYGNEIKVELIDTAQFDEDLPLHEKENGAYQEIPDPSKPINGENNAPKSFKQLTREVKAHLHLDDATVKGNIARFMKGGKEDRTETQKCVIDLYIDPIWSYFVNDESGLAENEITMQALIYNNQGKEQFECEIAPEITIKGKTNKPSVLEPVGNRPVLVDEIETNIADFLPCRLDLIQLSQQQKGGSTTIFNSNNSTDRRKNPILIDIIAGKKQTYLLDFDFKTHECERSPKHEDHELVLKASPAGFTVIKDGSSNTAHDEKEEEEDKSESSGQITITGVKTKAKDHVEYNDNKLYLRKNQVEFDGFYHYEIPESADALATFAAAIQYFWLPDLGDKVQKFELTANTCAYTKDIKVSLYPDISWTLKVGFNVTKEDIEALNTKGYGLPVKFYKALEDSKEAKQKELDAADQKFLDENKGLKEARYREVIATKNAAKLKRKVKKADEKAPESKGKLKGLIEILKRVTISLSEKHYGGDKENELTDAFVKEFYQRYAAQIQLVADAVAVVEGYQDPAPFSDDQEKSVEGLMKKLKRKPTEYELLYPKLSMVGSWYYEKIDASEHKELVGRSGLAIDINLKAVPLVGITITWDILELLCRRHPIAYAILKAVDALLYILADDESKVRCDFIVTGQVDAEIQMQHNMVAGFKNLAAKGKTAMQATIQLELKISNTIKLAKFEVILKVGFGAGASIGLGVMDHYGVDSKGFYFQKDLIFEGIKFSFEAEGSAELAKEEGKRKNSLFKAGAKIEGEITMGDHTFSTGRIYLS